MTLSPRHALFVDGIAAGKSQAQAYRDAGYRAKGQAADSEASRLVRHPKIVEELELRRRIVTARNDVTLDEIVAGLRKEARNEIDGTGSSRVSAWKALAEVAGLLRKDVHLHLSDRPVADLSPEERAAKRAQLLALLAKTKPTT